MKERRPGTISTDLLSIVAAVALIGSALGGLAWSRAGSDARREAADMAAVAAVLVRTEIQRSLAIARIEVETAAKRQDLILAARSGEGPCALSRRTAGTFASAHVSVLDVGGDIICTTMPEESIGISTYQFQLWLAAARRDTEAVPSSPFPDPFTRERSIAIAVAIRPKGQVLGFVTQVVPLDDVASVLRDVIAAGRDMALVIVRVDANEILSSAGTADVDEKASPPDARSFDAHKWPDGTSRVWGSAEMPDHGWRVYAGLPKSAVTKKSTTRFAFAFLAALLMGLVAMARVRRRLEPTISQVSDAIDQRAHGHAVKPVEPQGAAEVMALAVNWNAFSAQLDQTEEELVRAVFVDPATGLGNRKRLFDRLQDVMSSAGSGESIGLVVVGLDQPDGEESDLLATDAAMSELAMMVASILPPDIAIHRSGPSELAMMIYPLVDAPYASTLLAELTAEGAARTDSRIRGGVAIADAFEATPEDLFDQAMQELSATQSSGEE